MNKREKIIAVIMGIVIVIWIRNFTSAPPRKTSRSTKTDRQPVQARTPVPSKQQQKTDEIQPFDWQSVVEYGYLKYEDTPTAPIRDPFEVLDYRRVFSNNALDFAELSLSGIIWEQDAPFVIINNQILRAGEMISGFMVEEIRQNEVVLIKGTEKYILKLFSQEMSE